MLRNPVECRKRPLHLIGLKEALEDVILEIPIRRPSPFRRLKGQTCVPQIRNLRYVALLFHLPTSILGKNGEEGGFRMETEVLAFHLPFWRLPCGSCWPCPRPLHDKEVLRIDRCARSPERMQKRRCAQIDPPALRGMLHVGIGLRRVEREMLRPSHQTRLEHIQQMSRFACSHELHPIRARE